jgi:glucosamine-6-phosphate deaminase
MKAFKADNINVRIYSGRAELGKDAANIAGEQIRRLLETQKYVNIIFAAAPSQNEFLEALREQHGIDWQQVNAFHMDEYIGLPQGASQSFGTFLKERLFKFLPFNSVNYINGNAHNVSDECKRYTDLLIKYPPDMVCMGIGENGHIAFNDPHVANFNDALMVKVVDLDNACRQQQVNDGCFASLDQVPTHAITLTIPALIAGKFVCCMVPGKNKANAVYNTINGQIDEHCPASILRKHKQAILFLDEDSSSMLNSKTKTNQL